MGADEFILTEEGYQKIQDELRERETTTRDKIAGDIDLARQQGDLSENAAYQSALKDKEFNERRILELKNIINYAKVKKGNTSDKKVELSESFFLVDLEKKTKTKYQLVGGNEARPAEGKISINSPIGKAVDGKKYGDAITIETPKGIKRFKIERG